MGFRPPGFPTNRISMTDDQRFGLSRHVTLPGPLRLDGGVLLSAGRYRLRDVRPTLAPDGSNAILICHALTGDQYVASDHPITGKPGWLDADGRAWAKPIDPGAALHRLRQMCWAAAWARRGPATVNPRPA